MERARGFLPALGVALLLILFGCGGGSGGGGGNGDTGTTSGPPPVEHGIALTSSPEVGISTVSVAGSVSAPFIPESTDAFFSCYALSKTGKVAYGIVSAHAPRTHSIYVANPNGSNPQVVASTSVAVTTLASVVWSPDESELAYVFPDANGANVYRVDVSTGISQPVTSINDVDLGGSLAWTPAGNIYFVRGTGTARTIWMVPAAGGSPVQVTTTPGTMPSTSSDGSHLSFIDPTEDGQSATMIREIDLVNGGEQLIYTAPAGSILNAGYLNGNRRLMYTRVVSFNPASVLIGELDAVTGESTESPAPANVFVSAVATPGSGAPQVVF